MPDPIVVVGAGALGCLFAAHLAAAGARVVILDDWQAGLDALNTNGVTLMEEAHPPRRYSVQATSNPADCTGARFALVLVKGWQTEWAARQLAGCLSVYGVALTLQNGLGNVEILAHQLGTQRVSVGSTTWGAALEAPGIVRLNGRGDLVIDSRPELDPLVAVLTQAGFRVERSKDMALILWRKLVINAAINPLTALLDAPNGDLVASPDARFLLNRLSEEAALVAQAHGHQLPEQEMIALVEEVAIRTSANTSSMLQDFRRGAPTEIDAISGAIVRGGLEKNVPTPFSQAIYHLLKAAIETRHNKYLNP